MNIFERSPCESCAMREICSRIGGECGDYAHWFDSWFAAAWARLRGE